MNTTKQRKLEKKALNVESVDNSDTIDEFQNSNTLTSVQSWSITFLLLIHTMSALFGLSLPFIELIPKLECENSAGEWFKWTKEEAWANSANYRVDWSSDYSITNLMTSLDLIWVEDYKIGLLGSLAFLGFILSSITIMPTADIFGRKPVLILTTFISTTLCCLVYFCSNLTQIYICMFFIGYTILVRGTTSYVYFNEMVPDSLRTRYIPALAIIEKALICCIPFVFYLSKDWVFILTIYGWVSYVWVFYIWFIPESPKFIKDRLKEEESEAEGSKRLVIFIDVRYRFFNFITWIWKFRRGVL